MNQPATPKITPRIMFVLPSLSTGGAERVLITLLNNVGLPDKSLVVLNPIGELGHWIKQNIPVHMLNRRRVLFSLPALLKHVLKEKPDIIVSTMAHMNFGVLLLKPFLPKTTKIIVREAIVPSSFMERSPLERFCIRIGYRFLYPFADLVISPSQLIISEFQKLFGLPMRNHALLYNPVEVNRVRKDAADDFTQHANRRRNGLNILCVGRLVPAKGFDRLIETLAKWRTTDDWHVTILGEGKDREKLQSLIAAKGLQDKFSLPGILKNPWAPMAAADIFLLPSRSEGLPNVVLECLTAGTKVVAHREAGGIAEIAALAYGAVTVAQDMDDFITALEQATPDTHTAPRDSLLPDTFYLDSVIARFEALLRGEAPLR